MSSRAAAELPTRARVVVVGGGVGGASVAYHLTELGERDVLVLERAELTSGSTFHSAGMVGQLRSDPTLTRMNAYSAELYRKLEADGHHVGWVESGSLRLASSPERLEEVRRQLGWARAMGLPFEEVSAAEAADLFPLMDPQGVLGAAWTPTDGYVDPSSLCLALAAGARAGGARIAERTRVLAIDVEDGRVTRVRTDRGDVECEVVVNCGGIYAAQIGRLAGVRVPVVPMSHQYVVTEGFGVKEMGSLPSVRDPDLLVYYRPEVDGLVMGGYERRAAPWTASAAAFDDVPADFNGKLLAEDWERFEEITTNAQVRVPALGDVGVRKMINGPEAFTPDNEFVLGETHVAGFFVAAGFCAHGIAGAGGVGKAAAEWIVGGEAPMDLSHMEPARFGPAYGSPAYTVARTVENYQTYYDIRFPGDQRSAGRPLRTSPVYAWHRAAGAVFGEKAGWERVEYYAPHAAGAPDVPPAGWAGRGWSAAVAVEHRATREAAGLFDESSFAKLEIAGPGAAAFLERVCANRVAREVGRVVYTQMLNSRGGIESDCTVTRLAPDLFRLVTGTASGGHDLAWLRRAQRLGGEDVRITDVTSSEVCFALWGPRAPEILASLSPSDLEFAFMRAREVVVGTVPVRAQRVTYVGEPGWELYAPTEYGAGLWETVLAAGEPFGLVPCGYRAIESLRLEKGYRAWGSDIGPETGPDEAGLGFCVAPDKPGGFTGADAVRAQRAAGPSRRLARLVLDDVAQVVLGGEPVRRGGEVLGRVTSGGAGYTPRRSLAYAYLPVAAAGTGTRLEIDLFGAPAGAEVAD